MGGGGGLLNLETTMVYRGGIQSVKAQEQEGWMTNNRLQH